MSAVVPDRPDQEVSEPSLLFRLAISALLVLALSLGLIGFAVDHAFRAAERTALQERLDSNLFIVLAGLEVGPGGDVQWTGNLGESLLAQPGSGIYAGAFTEQASWLSPSTIDAPVDRLLQLPDLARGAQSIMEPGENDDFFVYQMGFGWETEAGEIIDLNVWAAEDRLRTEQTAAAFRGDLWRWLLLAGAVMLMAQLVMMALPIRVLRKVAGEVRAVESGRQQRLTGQYPRELKPLTDNLNALMETERANTQQYQSALGDLAHSLKTPLAVINAQLDDMPRSNAMEIRQTVTEMQHRIRHELDRAARSGRRTMLPMLEIKPVAQRMIESLRKLYPNQSFQLECPADLVANVAERDLIEVIGNLLDNAAKYSGGLAILRLHSAPAGPRRNGLCLIVDDDGPGLVQEEFERMLQRGIRGDQRSEGQGLGLAIVERIVSSYQGRIEAQNSPLGGLRVIAEFRPE